MNYRFLKPNEIIRRGDESKYLFGSWAPIVNPRYINFSVQKLLDVYTNSGKPAPLVRRKIQQKDTEVIELIDDLLKKYNEKST